MFESDLPLDVLPMREAFKQAQQAFTEDEVPVGAVITYKNQIIARAYNQVERLKDPTAHAEMIAITQASNYLSSKWLHDCVLYVTLEPCSMCAGALVLSRIPKIYYAAEDPKTGAGGSILNICNHQKLNHKIELFNGIMAKESSDLIRQFFQDKRNR